MRTRSAVTPFVLALCVTLVGAGGVSAVPPAAASFDAPIRLGFQAGDDWEPSIAADQSGHVYALWTHYVGFEGGATGEVD
ncbi:MAG: hypothetical protein M3537_00405, partial [Chloroflexota bacterium]|nr:hypothetical protein [Chloroflexota bacterium]